MALDSGIIPEQLYVPTESEPNLSLPQSYSASITDYLSGNYGASAYAQSNPIQAKLDAFASAPASADTMAAPEYFNWEKSGADRYVDSKYYKTLGFDPQIGGENEYRYGSLQTWGDTIGNALAGGGVLAANTFVEGWKGWGRMADALFTWDSSKLMGSQEEREQMNKVQEDVFNKYAIYDTETSRDSLFNRQFFGNMLQQTGFAVGAMAQAFLENYLTAGIGGGIAEGLSLSAKGLRGAVTAEELINDTRKVANAATRSDRLVSMIKNVPRTMVPLYGTIQDLNKINKAGAGLAQLGMLTASGIKRELSIFNMARSEAIFEAAGTYAKMKDDLMNEYIERTGQAPDPQTEERIKQSAEDASHDNFWTNTAVLALMNRIQFDNMIKGFNSTRKLFTGEVAELGEDAFTVAGKIAGKQEIRGFEKGLFGRMSAVGEIAKTFGKKTAAWEATKSLGRGLMKFETSEGVQELLQDASNKGLTEYYTDLYHGKKGYGSRFDAIVDSVENPLTNTDGMKTFLMGALTGRLIAPISAVGTHVIDRKATLDRKAKVKEALTIVNSFFADPTQYKKEWIANTKVQNRAAETMEEAAANHSRYVFYNTKNSAFAKAVASAIKLDMFDSLRDTLKEFGQDLNDEDFSKQLGMDSNTTNRKNVKSLMGEVVNQMEDYYTTYQNLRDKYADRVMPELYKYNDKKDYVKAKVAKAALDDAIEVLSTNVYLSRQAVKRASGLQTEMGNNKNIGGSAVELLSKAGSEVSLEKHQNLLEKEIATMQQAETLTDEQKELLTNKKEELEKVRMFRTSFKDILDETDPSSYPGQEHRTYKAFSDLINLFNKRANLDTTVATEDIDDIFMKYVDYVRLNRDHKSYVDAMNLLADPSNLTLITNSFASAIEMMGKLFQEQHAAMVKLNGGEAANDVETEKRSEKIVLKDKNGNNSEIELKEGEEYITEAIAEPRVYNGKIKTKAYKQDIIKIEKIDDSTITFSVNGSGESYTFTKDEFAENVGKLYAMSAMTPEQRIYFRNRNNVFELNVRAKNGKRHLIYGPHSEKDYAANGTVVNAHLELAEETETSLEPTMMFDENTGEYWYEYGDQQVSKDYVLRVVYTNPVTGMRESFEYDPNYLKKYGGNKKSLFDITESEEEYLKRSDEKRRRAQVDILNAALNDTINRFDQVAETKKANEEEYKKVKAELDEYLLKMDQLTQELAAQPQKKGRKSKARKELEARQEELAQIITKTTELVRKYEQEIENLEKELDTIENIYEAYYKGIQEIKTSGKPFTRDEKGNITPAEAQDDVKQLEQNQLIKPKRNISNEMLDKMVEDTENEIAALQERVDALNELLNRLAKISQLDLVPDVVDALENIDDKGQLLKQLNLIKNQESDPEKKKIVQGFINMINKNGSSLETAYLFDIADRYAAGSREIKLTREKIAATEDKLMRLYEAKEQRDRIQKAQDRVTQYKIIQNELVRAYNVRREKLGVKQEGNKVIVPVGTAVEDDLIKGADAILSTQAIEDLTPEGEAEKNSYTTVEGRIPVLTETAMFKTAGRHFEDTNDTRVNSPEDARFFKFSESAALRDSKGVVFFLMPVTKDSKLFQDLRETSWEEDGKTVQFDDDIRLVVVRRDATGAFKPVDINGNILTDPNKSNMIYTAMLGHPDLLSEDSAKKLSWIGKNFINKNELSDAETLAIADRFIKTRNEIKDRVKKGEPVYLPIEDKSPGVLNREPLGYNEVGEMMPQELSLEGRLIEDNPDFANLRHPDGSPVKLTVSTVQGKVRPGRMLMVKENDPNTSVIVYNRKFTEDEHQNIIDILKRMSELFDKKANGELTDEDESVEFQLGVKYLQGVIHWFSPKEGFAPHSFQMWVKSGLNIGEQKIEFTPESIEENKKDIIAAIPYYKINNSMLSDKRKNDSFTEIKVIDNKIVAGVPYKNYQHFLLTERTNGRPIVYTNIKPYTAPDTNKLEAHDYQLKNVYFRYGTDGILAEPVIPQASVAQAAPTTTSNSNPVSNNNNTGVVKYGVTQSVTKNPDGRELIEMNNNIPKGPKLTFIRKRKDGVTDLYVHTEYKDGRYVVVKVVDENGEDFTDVVKESNESGINDFIKEFDDPVTLVVESGNRKVQDDIIKEFFSVFHTIEDYTGKGEGKFSAVVVPTPAPVVAQPVAQAADTDYDKFVADKYKAYASSARSDGRTVISQDEFSSMFAKQLQLEYQTKKQSAIKTGDTDIDSLLNMADDDDSADIDPNARIGDLNAKEKEDVESFKAWMQENLDQFPVEILDGLVDGKYMGQFFRGVIKLSKIAEVGSGFHEAFEGVWNALLTKEQQDGLIQEFISRPDYRSQEKYQWAQENYPFLDERGIIKEALAEEFRQYMLDRGQVVKAQSPKRNTFFRKIWNFIKQLLGLGRTEKAALESKIQDLFGKIAEGKFKGAEILKSYNPEVKHNRAIPGTSVEFTQQMMEGMTGTFFNLLYQDHGNVQQLFNKDNDIFNTYYKKVYNTVYNTFNPGWNKIVKSDVYQNFSDEKKEATKIAYLNKRRAEDSLYDEKEQALLQFNDKVKERFKTYLGQFGLSFAEKKMSEEEMEELLGKEDTSNTLGIKEVIYVDPTNLTSPAVRLLILGLTSDVQNTDGVTTDIERNKLGLISLVPYRKKMNLLLNELSNLVPVMRKQADGSFKSVSALDQMMEKLSDKYTDPVHRAQFKPGYQWIAKMMRRLKYQQLKEGAVLSDDELKLLVAFENAFNRNKNIPLKIIVGANGKVRHVDAISVTTVQKIKEEWRNNIKDKALKADVSNLVNAGVVIINGGGFIEVNLDSRKLQIALNAPETDLKAVLESLAILGIKFSVPSDKFSFTDETNIKDAFRRMRSVLRDRAAKNEKFYYSEFFDRKTVEGPLNALLAIEANLRSEDVLLSHLTPEGKTQYAVTLPSEISHVINSLNGVSTLEEFVMSNPQYGSVKDGVVVLHPYLANSEVFKPGGMIFDQKGRKMTDIDYEFIQGMSSDVTRDGSNTDNLTFNDKIVQEIYHMFRGSYFTVINSDKSSEFAIKFGHFIKPSEVSDIKKIEEKYLNALKDELLHALHFHYNPNYIVNHQDKILMLGHFSGILGFNDKGDGSKLQKYFLDLVKNTKIKSNTKEATKTQLISSLVDNFVGTVKNEGTIKKYLDEKVKEHKEWLIDRSIVNRKEEENRYESLAIPVDNELLGSEIQNMDELQFTKLVRFLYVNRQLNVFEQHKLFYGHPALYKDLAKRSSGANSQKNAVSENSDVLNQMNMNKPRYDGRTRDVNNPIVRTLTYNDTEVVSNQVKSIAKALYKGLESYIGKEKAEKLIGAKFDKDGNVTKIVDGKGTYISAYTKMTEADGQSYIMPDYFRDLMYLSSLLTEDQEKLLDYENAEEVLERNNPGHKYHKQYTEAEVAKARQIVSKPRPKAVIQTLKPQGFGFALTDKMSHVNFYKNSVFPMTWSRVKNNPTMLAKYIDAQERGADMINFVSGHKVGAITKKDRTMVSMYNQDGSINNDVPDYIDVLSKYIGIQVETASYAKNAVIFGSQIRKIILSNLPAELEQYKDDYIAVLDELLAQEFDALLGELGIEYKNGVYNAVDLESMVNSLRDQAIKRGMPDNVVDMLETIKSDYGDQLRYPIDANPARERIEYVLNAIVDSRVVRIEMFGKSSVQVSSAMWEQGNRNLMYLKDGVWETVSDFNALTDVQKKSVKATSNDLKFYSGEQGFMEIYIPWYFEGINPESVGFKKDASGIWKPESPEAMEKLLTAVGFRIPTQAMNMIESVRIKGFLDPSYGDMLVVPSEMVGKSGSDFDIDKLNIFLANYKITANKRIEYIHYSTSDEEADMRYVEYVDGHAEKDVKKLMAALSSAERKQLRDKFKGELDGIRAQAELSFSTQKNEIYKDFENETEEAEKLAREANDYFLELFELNRKLYWRLSEPTRMTFESIRSYIKSQNIAGPREIELYLEHATKLRESDLFTDDNAVLDGMIKLYQEELKTLGYQEEVVYAMYKAAKDHFRSKKSELRDEYLKTKDLGISSLIEENNQEMFKVRLDMAKQMARLSGLMSQDEFKEQPVIKQNGKKRLQNRLIDIMKTIIEHPANRRQLLVPNSTAKLKAIAESIIALRGRTQVENDMTKLSEWKSMSETRETFVTSKQLVGSGALQITSHVMAQLGKLKLTGKYTDQSGEERIINIKLNNSKTNEMDLTIDAESEFIFEVLSQALSGSVDAAKDPFIFEIRLNLETAATWFYLAKRGVPQEEIALMFNQPIIDEFFKNLDTNRTYVNEANDNVDTFNEVIIKTAKKYYEAATGQSIPLDEFSKNTVNRFRSIQNTYSKYEKSDLTKAIGAKKLSVDQARMQVGILMDMLEYRNQADQLTSFIRGIGYDTTRTKTLVENKLQMFRFNKMMNEGFVTKDSIERVFKKSFLGSIKDIKDNLDKMFQEYFVLLKPKTLPVFDPLFKQLDNLNIRMSEIDKADLLNRYQTYVLTYILQNTAYGKNQAVVHSFDLFQDTPNGESLPKVLKKLKERYPENMGLKNLFPIINDDRKLTDNIKLFNNKINADEVNVMAESLDSLQSLVLQTGDLELQKFLDNLTRFTILQSGLQLSPITFTKVMPISLYADVAAQIFRSYTDSIDPLDVDKIWRGFHQNYYKNLNIVPSMKAKYGRMSDGLMVMKQNGFLSNFDYVKMWMVKEGVDRETLKNDLIPFDQKYELRLFEKIKIVKDGQDVTGDMPTIKYRPINMLGNGMYFVETSPKDDVTGASRLDGVNPQIDESLYDNVVADHISEMQDLRQGSTTPKFDLIPSKDSSVATMTYAGIGSRETPKEILSEMTKVATELQTKGFTVNTGEASGADATFRNATYKKNVFKKEDATDITREIAMEIHPKPEALSKVALDLMARNTFQVFNINLDSPVDFVLAYDPSGWEGEGPRPEKGGTLQAIDMAYRKGIPVINMANEGWRQKLDEVLAINQGRQVIKPTTKTVEKVMPIVKSDAKVVDYASFKEAKEAYASGKGVWTMRPNKDVKMDPDKHYGNPWSTPKAQLSPETIVVKDNEEAITNYRNWLNGTAHQDIQPARRKWIIDQINSGKLNGKKLIYYKPSNYYSHADVLSEFINGNTAPFTVTSANSEVDSVLKDLDKGCKTR